MKKLRNLDQGKFLHTIYENSQINKPRVITLGSKIIYSSSDTIEYNFFDFHEDHYKNTAFEKINDPYLIITGFGTLPNLEKLLYDDLHVQHFNNVGLTIYLQEVLVISYYEKKPIMVCNYENLSDNELNELRNIVYGSRSKINYENMFSAEFESIKVFVDNNKLTNVTIKTYEKNADKFLQKFYPNFKISNHNIWSDYVMSLDFEYTPFSLNSQHIIKHFYSPTRRYMPERHLLTAHLLKKSAYLSFLSLGEIPTIENLKKYLWFDLEECTSNYTHIFENLKIIEKIFPITLDEDKSLLNISPCSFKNLLPLEYMQNSFCHVVAQTRFVSPFSISDERVRQTMLACRPFIILGPPHSLEFIRDQGYKTFNNFFDETYDNLEDHKERLFAIFDLLNSIETFTIDKCRKLLEKMQVVLEHNFNHIPYNKFK